MSLWHCFTQHDFPKNWSFGWQEVSRCTSAAAGAPRGTRGQFDSVALTRFLKATNDAVRHGPMGKVKLPIMARKPRVSWRGCTRKMDAFEMGLKFLWIWNNMFNTCERKVSGTIGTIPIDKTFKCTPTESEDQLDYAKWTPSGSLRSRTRPWSMESMESIVWSDTVCNRGQRKPHPNDKTLDASLCVRWDPHQEQFGCYPNQTLLALSLCLEFFVWQSRFCCSQSMIDPHVHHFMISWSASGVGTRLVPGLPFFRPRRKEEEQQLQ